MSTLLELIPNTGRGRGGIFDIHFVKHLIMQMSQGGVHLLKVYT